VLPDGPAELQLAAHFLVQSSVVSGLILLGGLLAGRRYVVLLSLLLLTAAGLVLAPHVGPRMAVWGAAAPPAAPAAGIPPIKAYFHNTWAGNSNDAAVVGAALASDADLVMFAETGPWRWRRFAPLLERYPHHISCTGRDECDLTLFSRLPIDDPTVFHDRLSGARGIAATVGNGIGGRIRVVAVHLARPIPPDSFGVQMGQVDALLRSPLFHPDLPVLLMGDFNAVPWGRAVRAFATGLRLRPAGGIEGSWPDFLPMPLRIRIDQALVSSEVDVVGQTLGPGGGSDHRSLAITIGPMR
jgi:endonuclease/exonuclease/phosphatase (EEP) superfamily protein YafD